MITPLHFVQLQVSGKLALSARPRGGDWLEDEVLAWVQTGVSMVVSLLEQHEIEELELHHEAKLCEEHSIKMLCYPIPDRGVPGAGFQDVVSTVVGRLTAGDTVLVHCRMGIGRTGVLAAATLMAVEGVGVGGALERVSTARGIEVPDTAEQIAWLEALAGSAT